MTGAAVASIMLKTCQSRDCVADLAELMSHHRVMGQTIVGHEIKKYAKLNPGQEEEVAAVATLLGLPKVASQIPEPPGDCDPGEQQRLQSTVNQQCKGGDYRKCVPSDSLGSMMQKIEAARSCGLARHKINTKCFRGGDIGHRTAAENAFKTVAKCEELMDALE